MAEQVQSSLIYASGLPTVMPGEMVVFESGEFGEARYLYHDLVEILLFSDHQVRVGTKVTRTGEKISVGVGEELLGQVINPLGAPVRPTDASLSLTNFREIDNEPPGIEGRVSIKRPLETGVITVDMLVPLGKGQRELVIGDRKTGKTSFVLSAVVTQAKKGSVCIYGAIGKKRGDIKRTQEYFQAKEIFDKVIMVVTFSQDPASLIYLTPYTAITLAEYFRDKGQDVLVVLDDLSGHAKYCRELSLLARRFPGRDSYPVDIFYMHARLMERAGNFKTKDGEVSITVLPVAETINGDLSGYIQTNVMSMTDGHIYFDSDLFSKGRRPAVNPFLSVTRVGHQAQSQVEREVSRELLAFLAYYEEVQGFIHFGAELTDVVKETLAKGEQVTGLLDQQQQGLVPLPVGVFVLALLWAGKWKGKSPFEVKGDIELIMAKYASDAIFAKRVDGAVEESKSLAELLGKVNAFEEAKPKAEREQIPTVVEIPK